MRKVGSLMALLKNSLHYFRSLNLSTNSHSKVLFGWLNVEYSQVGSRLFHGEVNPRTEAKLREKDGIPNDYKIIYRAPYEMYCKFCYGLTAFSTTLFPSVFTSLLVTQGIDNYPIMFYGIVLAKSSTDVLVYTGGLAITIANVSAVIFKYPFRIYRNLSCDKYIMVYQHIIPWKLENEELNAGELKKTEKSFMPWQDSLYEFKKRKAILIQDHFQRPVDLEIMLKSKDKMNP